MSILRERKEINDTDKLEISFQFNRALELFRFSLLLTRVEKKEISEFDFRTEVEPESIYDYGITTFDFTHFDFDKYNIEMSINDLCIRLKRRDL